MLTIEEIDSLIASYNETLPLGERTDRSSLVKVTEGRRVCCLLGLNLLVAGAGLKPSEHQYADTFASLAATALASLYASTGELFTPGIALIINKLAL